MESIQVERRRERARAGGYRIRNLGEEPVHSRFEVLSASGSRYEVEVRDPTSLDNGCTCPDFETNLLGTCKHVEAVLLHLRRAVRGPARALLREPSPHPHLFLAYGAEVEVRLHRPPRLAQGLSRALDALFDETGRLRGDPVRAFRRVERGLADLGVRVAPEVRDFVEGLEERRRSSREREVLEAAIAAGRERFDLLRTQLYPYQVKGALHVALGGRAILGDEMGLGKTVQAIAACEWLRRTRGVERVLVVCPASLKHQWEREVRRFCDSPVTVVEGPRARRAALYRTPSFFTVANYELVRLDARALAEEEVRFDVVILDEAQRIKNWRAKTSDAVKRLRRKSARAFVLTGTPLENNLDELYSVLQFVDPRILGPLWKFNERYHAFDAQGRVLGHRNLDELRRRIAPVFLRRRKEEVALDLPGSVENTYFVEMSREQREIHDEHEEAAARILAILKRRPLLPREKEILQRHLAMMRMACDTPFILDRGCKVSPKLDELEPILEELVLEGGRKALVFSEWERMGALAAERLERRGIGFARLHGGVPSPSRGALLDRFSRDPSCRVFLSTDAGGLGLNLQAASVVVHLDLPWNPARYDQRVGRAVRIGQKETVQVVRLVSRGTIEERMLDTIARKRTLFEAVVSGEGPAEVALPSRRDSQIALLSSLVGGDGEKAGEAKHPGESTAAVASPPRPSATLVPVPKGADELDAIRSRLEEALGEALDSVERTAEGTILVVVRGEVAREAVARALGGPEPFAILDGASYEALRPVLASQGSRPRRAAGGPTAPRLRLLKLAAQKLEAGRCLLEGGFPGEAILRAAEAGEETVRAMLHGEGEPPQGPALLAAAYAACRKGSLSGEALEKWRLLRDLGSLAATKEGAAPEPAEEAIAALEELFALVEAVAHSPTGGVRG